MMAQMCEKQGFFAALDQSGGSTPGALRLYGIPETAYSDDAEMFKLIHEMRVRIITAPAFTGDKIIGAILFEATMDGQAQGKPVPAFLWEDRGVVPFLKVDKGLEAEADGVQLMKPIPGLDALLERAVKLGIFGTKMRSVINLNSQDRHRCHREATVRSGRADRRARSHADSGTRSVDQESGQGGRGSHPPRRTAKGLDALPESSRVMLKLTIPDVADFYRPLIEHPRVARVVALSGGYTRTDACERLARITA